MKKFITFILAGLLIASTAMAQSAMTNPNALALDTVTQAAAEGPVITVSGKASSVSFTMLLTKVSGTVAGTVTLQGSNSIAKGYQNVTGSNDQVTFTLTDATQTIVLSQSPKRFLFYRVLISPTGTWSGSYSATEYTVR